jgi:hypothetical protein
MKMEPRCEKSAKYHVSKFMMGLIESKHTGDSEDVQRHDCGGATVVAKLSKIRRWKEVKDSC